LSRGGPLETGVVKGEQGLKKKFIADSCFDRTGHGTTANVKEDLANWIKWNRGLDGPKFC
jgi:hypothetical protein